jgi:hypothetical protein
MLENLIRIDDSVFGHINVLHFLDDNIVLLFDIVVEETMIVFELNVLAEESKLVPLYFVVVLIFCKILFKLIDSDPWKILTCEGRTFFLSFYNFVLKCQLNRLDFFLV